MNQLYGSAQRCACTVLAGVFSACCSLPVVEAQEVREERKAAPLSLDTSHIVAPPLNDAYEVNAGAFGAKTAMEIPLVIQSYDAKTIADSSARTAVDVLSLDPSILSASAGSGFDNFRLRGFAMDNFNTIRRDGLALAPHHDFPLENVERIDVLKGPSGFLYGVNSPGGTINYIPKRPTLDPLLNLTVQGSSLAGRYVAIDNSNSTADGAFGYRLNAGYEKNGDYDHARDMERKFIGLATDWRLSDRALLQLNGDWSWKSTVADPLLRADQSHRANPLDASSYVRPPKINRRDLLTGSWFRHQTEGKNLDAKFEYTLSDNWTSITQANYSQVERHGGYNDLFNIQPNGDIGTADLYVSRGEVFSTWSLQSYLAGKFNTGSLYHDVFLGTGYKQFKDRSPAWDDINSANPGVRVSDVSVGNIRHPVQPPKHHFGPENDIEFVSRIKESSVFASDLVSLNEQFQVLLGGRYIWYRADHLSANALPQRHDVFVPSGALIYRPLDNLMTYVSYSRGLEKGDYAPWNATNKNQPTDAIESEQYEVGLKAELDSRASLGLALFEIRRNASYLDTSNTFVSKGQYRHRGIELNLSHRPTDSLTLDANLAYLATRLENVDDLSVAGNRTEGVPKWKGSFGAQYQLQRIPGLSLDSTLSLVGSRPVDAQNSGYIPGYALLDAGASYRTRLGETPVTYRLHGKNLTNTYYYASTYYQGGLEVGREREVFLSARFEF
ncbi:MULTISPECIES: TonB-dependent siderophore receptor [unclassified Pseudomonas]|uniref:TonB-dependent receptor n=1 Tax=unclassified Pseudomonas TaxID=196821 RepID=UPI0009F68307|nr:MULTISPECIES: TonB-dependent siderophore receptor [unclassified Pseudomonas]QIH05529.1 TonB-dependent siderophore receptor [Pseudomonas sp. BIOMIG1BAC]